LFKSIGPDLTTAVFHAIITSKASFRYMELIKQIMKTYSSIQNKGTYRFKRALKHITQVQTERCLRMAVFWGVALFSLLDVDRSFGGF
jgi:hypothetical protein